MKTHDVYISLGSNMGDTLENCANGILKLTASDVITLTAQSPFYRTEPVGYRGQDWFINAVVLIKTRLSPVELLEKLMAIQTDAGRVSNGIRFGPRILDLDILLYDDLILYTHRLIVPHPRMHKRHFVLQPICDINPEIIHPVLNRKMGDLLNNLNHEKQQIIQLDDY